MSEGDGHGTRIPRALKVFGSRVDKVVQDTGFPNGRFSSPRLSVFLPSVALLGLAFVAWGSGNDGALAVVVARSCLGVVGFVGLVHQIYWLLFARRFVYLYGQKKIPRNPEDGIGKSVHDDINAWYVRKLLDEGYAHYGSLDLNLAVELLLEPHKSNLRITEEILTDGPLAKHSVTKDIRIPKVPEKGPLLVPVADFPKGLLLDGLEVTVDSKPATTLSYDESLRVSAALVLTTRAAEELSGVDVGSGDNVVLPDGAAFLAELRNRVAPDIYEVVRPANSLTDKDKSVTDLLPPAEDDHSAPLRGEWLVAQLRTNYVLYALVDEPKAALKITYSRTTALHGSEAVKSERGWRQNWAAEIRFRWGQFPSRITLTTPLMYKCESYHLRISLPDGLYVHTHEIHKRVNASELEPIQQESFKRTTKNSGPIDTNKPMIPTYMRARDHRALPYAHFYARNGYDMERILHTHVLNVVENPFATLRLAATLLFLSALGLIVAGMTFVNSAGDYNLKSGVVAVVVSAPGVLSSWSRQAFGVEALRRASLTTQFALRATTLFSFAGLVVAVFQDSGLLHWRINIHLMASNGLSLPIHDGVWLVMSLAAMAASMFAWCRYHKRRMQYLALRRRSLTSVHNRSIGEAV
ncbi:hypothetical protein [Amycolatopsis sp. NPDC004079]|uniref:hypothetical protein n=1 Tax=Amycolatopsis sp. NPDC004079 TaxID=3154549 RepID=UPI0033B3A18B